MWLRRAPEEKLDVPRFAQYKKSGTAIIVVKRLFLRPVVWCTTAIISRIAGLAL
jgi:hypothetical protein